MLTYLTHRKMDERILDTFPEVSDFTFNNIFETFHYVTADDQSSNRAIFKSHIVEWETKFKKTLDRFIPEDVNCYIAGGAVLTYILYGNELMIKDYDIFVCSTEDFTMIDSHLRSLNPQTITENRNTKHFSFGHIEIDLIKMVFLGFSTLMSYFDIDVCRVGFSKNKNSWRFMKEIPFYKIFAREFTMKFEREIDFKTEGIICLRRIIKYCNKGFIPSTRTITRFYTNVLLANNPGFSDLNDSEKTILIDVEQEVLHSVLEKDYLLLEEHEK